MEIPRTNLKSARNKKNILTEMKNTFRGLIHSHGTAEENEIEDVCQQNLKQTEI